MVKTKFLERLINPAKVKNTNHCKKNANYCPLVGFGMMGWQHPGQQLGIDGACGPVNRGRIFSYAGWVRARFQLGTRYIGKQLKNSCLGGIKLIPNQHD